MYDTDVQELEQMMMLVPNLVPRMKGMVIVGKRLNDENEEFKKLYLLRPLTQMTMVNYINWILRLRFTPQLLDYASNAILRNLFITRISKN